MENTSQWTTINILRRNDTDDTHYPLGDRTKGVGDSDPDYRGDPDSLHPDMRFGFYLEG